MPSGPELFLLNGPGVVARISRHVLQQARTGRSGSIWTELEEYAGLVREAAVYLDVGLALDGFRSILRLSADAMAGDVSAAAILSLVDIIQAHVSNGSVGPLSNILILQLDEWTDTYVCTQAYSRVGIVLERLLGLQALDPPDRLLAAVQAGADRICGALGPEVDASLSPMILQWMLQESTGSSSLPLVLSTLRRNASAISLLLPSLVARVDEGMAREAISVEDLAAYYGMISTSPEACLDLHLTSCIEYITRGLLHEPQRTQAVAGLLFPDAARNDRLEDDLFRRLQTTVDAEDWRAARVFLELLCHSGAVSELMGSDLVITVLSTIAKEMDPDEPSGTILLLLGRHAPPDLLGSSASWTPHARLAISSGLYLRGLVGATPSLMVLEGMSGSPPSGLVRLLCTRIVQKTEDLDQDGKLLVALCYSTLGERPSNDSLVLELLNVLDQQLFLNFAQCSLTSHQLSVDSIATLISAVLGWLNEYVERAEAVRNRLIRNWNRMLGLTGGEEIVHRRFLLFRALDKTLQYMLAVSEEACERTSEYFRRFGDQELFCPLDKVPENFDPLTEGTTESNSGAMGYLTPLGLSLLTGSGDAEQDLQIVCALVDTISLTLPVLSRCLLEDVALVPEGRAPEFRGVYRQFGQTILRAIRRVLTSTFQVPHVLAYRKDPYHNALEPRKHQSNDPLRSLQTFEQLEALRARLAGMQVASDGRIYLMSSDTEWLHTIRDGDAVARLVLHNLFDDLLVRSTQAGAAPLEREIALITLEHIQNIGVIDGSYVAAQRNKVLLALHAACFIHCHIRLPHIEHFAITFLAVPGTPKPTIQEVLAQIERPARYELNEWALQLGSALLRRLLEVFGGESPSSALLDVVLFFLGRGVDVDLRSAVAAFMKAVPQRDAQDAPPELSLPVDSRNLPESLPDLAEWRASLIAMHAEYQECRSRDAQDGWTPSIRRALDVFAWPCCSPEAEAVAETLGSTHESRTYTNGRLARIERQRDCLACLLCDDFIKILNGRSTIQGV
ncbi:hypothetical protein GMRT_21108 [Giardia muris]|uniref:Uncharacterized protein n=1 Tax=Giardia muris TaxID=5742 RepID=A0A4Z1SX42_GIAMU|nr:hypothetical protein GMRT_21108 [Giardia muris]|eukprot:TNJ30286.1 hypothetical protein GMRT_21108 [Giardia muris]